MPRLGLALTLLALLAPPGPARALGPLVQISGPTPIPRSCEAPGATRDSEVEPTLAADPRGSGAVVAAWQQDRYRVSGGAAALGAAYSRDGGATWAPAAVAPLTGCLGRHGRASDPWLSYGPDGTVYLTAIAGTLTSGHGLRTSIAVSASRDGGATWSQPVTLAPAIGPFNDKPAVTADPTRPGFAYVVWSQLDKILLSRTTDGGVTWSPAHAIAHGQLLNISTVSVLDDGTLLHAFFRGTNSREWVMASRSTDAGTTWSKAVRVGAVKDATPHDLLHGVSVRGAPLAQPAAVGGSGERTYAAWPTVGNRPGGQPRVVLARSLDGGVSWGRPRPIIPGRAAQFAAALASAPDGTVAVTTYRLLRGGRADAVAAVSADGGSSWAVRKIAPPFSLRDAPRANGGQRFLGDYTGLTAAPGGGFLAALALAPPVATRGPSDVFLAPIPLR